MSKRNLISLLPAVILMSSLSGCEKKSIICSHTPTCCRIETAPNSFISECLRSEQCDAKAKNYPHAPVVYPANDQGVNTIGGCVTGTESSGGTLAGVLLESPIKSPVLVEAKYEVSGSSSRRREPLAGTNFEQSTKNRTRIATLGSGSGPQCKQMCASADARCLPTALTDTPGATKEEIANGLRSLYDSLATNPTDRITSAYLLRSFGMNNDPCKRGDTTIAPSSTGTDQTLTNSGAIAGSCTVSMNVPPSTPGGNLSVIVPAKLQGIIQHVAGNPALEVKFNDVNATFTLHFQDQAFQSLYGGEVVDVLDDGSSIYVATLTAKNGYGCFQLPVAPPLSIPAKTPTTKL